MRVTSRKAKAFKRRLGTALSPSVALVTALCAAALGNAVYAQTAPEADTAGVSSTENDTIIVTGTRVTGMTIEDTAKGGMLHIDWGQTRASIAFTVG